MRTKCSLWMLSLLIVTAAACRKEAVAPAPAAAAPAAAAYAPAASAVANTAASEFGIPECDEYINKYLSCVESHVPEAAREQVRASLEQTRAAWRQAAATEQGRAGLVMGCKASSDASKAAMAAYGCSF